MEEDPAWVGLAPTDEPLVLPDFPIPEPTNVPPVDENGNQIDTSPVNRIVLPSIGVDTVVKYVPYDGFTWLIAGLQQEIAWMGDTSWPGLGGNTGLAGHVSLRNGRDGPFRYLDSLRPNDQVKLYTEENIYIYSVRELQIVSDTDFSVIEATKDPQLTLITCSDWDPQMGLYRDRLIVIADLTGVESLKRTSQGN
jgi:sortase A